MATSQHRLTYHDINGDIGYNIEYDLNGGELTCLDWVIAYSNGQIKLTNPTQVYYCDGINYKPTYYDPYTDEDTQLNSPNYIKYFVIEHPTLQGANFVGWYVEGMDNCEHHFWINGQNGQQGYDASITASNYTFYVSQGIVTNFYNLFDSSVLGSNSARPTVKFHALWDDSVQIQSKTWNSQTETWESPLTWKNAYPYIYTNGEWKRAIPYIYDGTSWKKGIR